MHHQKFTDYIEQYYHDRGVSGDLSSRLRHHLCSTNVVFSRQVSDEVKLGLLEEEILQAAFPEAFRFGVRDE